MSGPPLVSIALATCNAGEYLDAQVESLLAQTWACIEIVVSDDGSTDGTRERLETFAARDSRIRLLPAGPSLGINGNFLRCFAACHGDFISPCDQDDVWSVDKTARLLMACPPGGIAYCDSTLVDAQGQTLPSPHARMSDIRRMTDDPPALGLLRANCVSGHAMLFERSLLYVTPPAPAATYYDWWLVLVARAWERPVRYLDASLVRYRRHASAATVRRSPGTSRTRKLETLQRQHALGQAAAELATNRLRDDAHAGREAFSSWIAGNVTWQAFRFNWRHRQALFWQDRRPALSALRYLFGQRLRHRLMPWRHPDVEIVGGRLFERSPVGKRACSGQQPQREPRRSRA